MAALAAHALARSAGVQGRRGPRRGVAVEAEAICLGRVGQRSAQVACDHARTGLEEDRFGAAMAVGRNPDGVFAPFDRAPSVAAMAGGRCAGADAHVRQLGRSGRGERNGRSCVRAGPRGRAWSHDESGNQRRNKHRDHGVISGHAHRKRLYRPCAWGRWGKRCGSARAANAWAGFCARRLSLSHAQGVRLWPPAPSRAGPWRRQQRFRG
jgi:hypothetical protein